jgi:hypothetical protein
MTLHDYMEYGKQCELFEREPSRKHVRLLRRRSAVEDHRARVQAALELYQPLEGAGVTGPSEGGHPPRVNLWQCFDSHGGKNLVYRFTAVND